MLVLSRRQDQKILFPNLGITVEIISVRGKNVKVGVDAPKQIRIVREELFEDEWDFENREVEIDSCEMPTETDSDSRSARHHLNNRLNALGLRLQLIEKLIEQDRAKEGVKQLRSVLEELQQLDQGVDQNQPKTSSVASGGSQIKANALVVEDNSNERQLLSTILEMTGISVVGVCNGEEALRYLENNPLPDVVLVDMEMPILNGPQTIELIRNKMNMKDLPIYGVSGLKRSETNIPLSCDGVND